MKQTHCYSKNGDTAKIFAEMKDPKAIIFFADKTNVEKAADEIHKRFPDAVSIGCVGQSYAGRGVYEDGLLVIGYEGVDAVGGVIENVGTMPLASIETFKADVQKIKPGKSDTVCVDFTTGNDAELVTTMNIALKPNQISLVGGTAWEDTVVYNGKVYHDACVYMLLRNLDGKIKAYKENLYGIHPDSERHVATKVDPARCGLYELDGKPAQRVYADMLGLSGTVDPNQTMQNPLGRVIGDEIYLLSLRESIEDGGFICYKKVNAMDIITMMELKDMNEIIQNTLDEIRSDFPRIQGMFSINCVFRHLLFQQEHYEDQYLQTMETLGSHAGLIGLGEHYNTQHVNQTMSGFAFD